MSASLRESSDDNSRSVFAACEFEGILFENINFRLSMVIGSKIRRVSLD